MVKVGRNDPCPCGSGKKFKKCHGNPSSGPTSGKLKWSVESIHDAPPNIRARFREMRKESIANSFAGPQPIKLDFQGHTFRAIKNRLLYTKKERTYIDFLLDLIKTSFGKKWHTAQVQTPKEQRHLVMQWMGSWYEHCMSIQAKTAPEGGVFGSTPTGDGLSLLTLGDDLYRLQLAQRLTSKLMSRLRDPNEFQGARYEMQVASIFLRSGFDIEWVQDDGSKHCEFCAVHKHSKQRVAVEAKSRHRPGVLGMSGHFSEDHPIGLEPLEADARRHNPGDSPFCIFIDVNWPVHPELPKLRKPWMKEVFELAQKHIPSQQAPEAVSLSVFTNYSWHYQGKSEALPHETLFTWPLFAMHPITDRLTRDALMNSIVTYGVNIEESPAPMLQDSVLEQLVTPL
jgi:hypothetical protein